MWSEKRKTTYHSIVLDSVDVKIRAKTKQRKILPQSSEKFTNFYREY